MATCESEVRTAARSLVMSVRVRCGCCEGDGGEVGEGDGGEVEAVGGRVISVMKVRVPDAWLESESSPALLRLSQLSKVCEVCDGRDLGLSSGLICIRLMVTGLAIDAPCCVGVFGVDGVEGSEDVWEYVGVDGSDSSGGL